MYRMDIIREDTERGYILAHYGGHGIHVLNLLGDTVAFFNVAATDNDCAPASTIINAMDQAIQTGNYCELIEV